MCDFCDYFSEFCQPPMVHLRGSVWILMGSSCCTQRKKHHKLTWNYRGYISKLLKSEKITHLLSHKWCMMRFTKIYFAVYILRSITFTVQAVHRAGSCTRIKHRTLNPGSLHTIHQYILRNWDASFLRKQSENKPAHYQRSH